MNNKIQLPCETCITRAICKFKKEISCDLLLETFYNIPDLEPEIFLEMMLCDLFEWDIKNTYVVVVKTVYISDCFLKERIRR